MTDCSQLAGLVSQQHMFLDLLVPFVSLLVTAIVILSRRNGKGGAA